MDDFLAGHLVDKRNRLAQRVLHPRGVPRIDGGTDRAQRATQPAPVHAVRLALHEILSMGLDCGIVTSHKLLILAYAAQLRPFSRRSSRRSRLSGAPSEARRVNGAARRAIRRSS